MKSFQMSFDAGELNVADERKDLRVGKELDIIRGFLAVNAMKPFRNC